jgi:hypothetical protein
MMKAEIAALSLSSKIIMTEYLTSIFVIPCSIFLIYPRVEDLLFQDSFLHLNGISFGRWLG